MPASASTDSVTPEQRIADYLGQATKHPRGSDYDFDPLKTPAAKSIKSASPDVQAACVRVAVETDFSNRDAQGKPNRILWQLAALLTVILRKKLHLDDTTLGKLVTFDKRLFIPSRVTPWIVQAIETAAESDAEMSKSLRASTERLLESLRKAYPATARKYIARLEAVLGVKPVLPFDTGDIWAERATEEITADNQHNEWAAILQHAATATASAPSKKWLTEAAKLREAVGTDRFVERLSAWAPLFDKTRPRTPRHEYDYHATAGQVPSDTNADLIKGLVWMTADLDNRDAARAVARICASGYRKVPGTGPRAPRVGNACVTTLGLMPGRAGLEQLGPLKTRIKFGTAQRLIEKAFQKTAERLGLPVAEIEELAVPDLGLTGIGLRRETLGDVTAELRVASDGSAKLHWIKPDGKEIKSVPASVKSDHAEMLKELRADAKDLGKNITAQKERLDNLFLAQKSWPVAVWRERYLDHPVVGVLARRLIWTLTTGDRSEPVFFHQDALIQVDDAPATPPTDATTVTLWHPIDHPVETVVAWREFLARHQITQPFKQAHREIYLLTDAERRTETYSNRFAAHILRQHQFNALCGARGWKNQLRLMVDADYEPASRILEPWGLRAEFWVEGAGDNYQTDVTPSGAYLHLATDQVRFYHEGAAKNYSHASGGGYRNDRRHQDHRGPLPLDQVPPLVLSEIMRDVDLFVGVASVGNDPTWSDGGPQGRYRDYWQSYSFGDLSQTATTRKAVLERIVPKLKIHGQCRFEERFLIVQGSLRTYKIHLGSGNILMEPNDQYLCIVPKSGGESRDKIFLPFEGDAMLSIILSKAVLLASDTKITDPTITRQIQAAK